MKFTVEKTALSNAIQAVSRFVATKAQFCIEFHLHILLRLFLVTDQCRVLHVKRMLGRGLIILTIDHKLHILTDEIIEQDIPVLQILRASLDVAPDLLGNISFRILACFHPGTVIQVQADAGDHVDQAEAEDRTDNGVQEEDKSHIPIDIHIRHPCLFFVKLKTL